MRRQIILASVSPRRRQLFELFHLPFKPMESGFEEIVDPKKPHSQMVLELALGKARAAAKKYPRALIVAADTMVSFRGKIIGKPRDRAEAYAMLKSFSGKSQSLVTGAVVMDAASKKFETAIVKNIIHFKYLSRHNIELYIKKAKPLDKAGGYNLQGFGFNLIRKIDGDFTNSLGLPMGFVFNAIEKFNIKF